MGRSSDARERLISAAQRLVWAQSYATAGVDAICREAGVQKGSFYHFFASKAELVAAALDAKHAAQRAALDDAFSASRPPLERLGAFFRHVEAEQRAAREQAGHTLGCPFGAVGAETAGHEPELAARVCVSMDRTRRYLESAVRDAQAAGEVRADASVEALSDALFTHLQGVLVQARLRDDPAVAAPLEAAARLILGAPGTADAAKTKPRKGPGARRATRK